MKKKIVPIILLSSLLVSGFAIGISNMVEQNEIIKVEGYSVPSSLNRNIDLNNSTADEIKAYYASLNNLDVDERKGTNLLKNLKEILKKDQIYYLYPDDKTSAVPARMIWQIYEIADRDWTLSPASEINGYNAQTNKITNYQYGTSTSNPGSNPYLHALYVNRDVDNHIHAWRQEDGSTSSHLTGKDWCIAREHIWPKSNGLNYDENAAGGARGDPMHLWSSDTQVNSNGHNNYAFAYVDLNKKYTDASSEYAKGNIKGYALNVGGDVTGTRYVFEPQDSDKGDIARAIFYMAARYNFISGSDSDGIDHNNPNLTLYQNDIVPSAFTSSETNPGKIGLMTDLLAWHKADPVDEFEIHRNSLLYKNYTNNRNPFIDYPEWADYIWGTVNYNDKKLVSYDSTPTGYVDTTKDVINGYRSTKPVTGVTLNKTSIILNEGSTTTLVATVTPNDATNKDVTWSSSNTSVATVNSSGKVTAKSSGNAVITVTTDDGGFTATCNVKVDYEITSITATCSKSFYVGDKITRDDISVVDNKNNPVTDFIFNDNNYMFKYSDAVSGGAETSKTFSVSYGNLSDEFTVHVSREKFEGGSVTDLLNRDFTGITTNTYDSWTKTSDNGVTYVGHSAGGNGSIQLRTSLTSSTYYSGIVTTNSVGNFKKIVVDWNPNTAAARKIQIFGKNTPYSGTSDLYDNSTRGTLLGEIGTTATTYTATADYAYIGIRSASSPLYLNSIIIEYGGEITSVSLSNYIMYEDTPNQCETKTDVAIGYFNSLTDQEEFMTSEDYVIVTARTRFNAWLAHEGKEIVPNNNGYVISNSSIYLLEASKIEDNNMIIIVLIASSTLIAFTTLLIIKKKRRK